jgi:hypothetical protein
MRLSRAVSGDSEPGHMARVAGSSEEDASGNRKKGEPVEVFQWL